MNEIHIAQRSAHIPGSPAQQHALERQWLSAPTIERKNHGIGMRLQNQRRPCSIYQLFQHSIIRPYHFRQPAQSLRYTWIKLHQIGQGLVTQAVTEESRVEIRAIKTRHQSLHRTISLDVNARHIQQGTDQSYRGATRYRCTIRGNEQGRQCLKRGHGRHTAQARGTCPPQ
ncbi:MAG: hypothetical protein BWY63_00471 [Chloroflexi bacterium ADurb.Bin360]|nr:MAG: hypothetical protein BWY63_00471 [Chloroflexi bacterium ADurb.Bin360]